MLNKVNYSSSTKHYKFALQKFKRSIFKRLSKNSVNYFLRGQDKISIEPSVNGVYEPDITELISYFNEIGYCDFLFDIGANIGLTSCQNGLAFDKVFCFEPNPLCLHILKVNTEIALDNINIEINEFGLGKNDDELELWIPKLNWGGAFVKSKDNSYSDNILASKDGFLKLDSKNYIIKNIQIKSCKDILEKKFTSLLKNGFKNGVIKIDVEGMEEIILKGISQSIPDKFKLMIIFENWDPNFSLDIIKKYFSNYQTSFMILNRSTKYKNGLLKLFSNSNLVLSPLETNEPNVGDIVIQIGNVVA